MELDTFLKKGLWAFACFEDSSLGVGAFQLSFVEAVEESLGFIKGKQEGVFWQQKLRHGAPPT